MGRPLVRCQSAKKALWLAAMVLAFVVVGVGRSTAAVDPSDFPNEPGANQNPTASDLSESFAHADQTNSSGESYLQSPAAQRERTASQDQFEDLGPSAATNLLQAEFSDQLDALDADPARSLSDAQLEQPLSRTDARVELDGKTLLLDGDMPVRALDTDGQLHKIDLTLNHGADQFTPQNPLTPISLPDAADGPIRFGPAGSSVTVVGAKAASARLVDDKDLIYPNVLNDTDVLGAPTASGLEMSFQLRSAESPRELDLVLHLPDGYRLDDTGTNGIAIEKDDHVDGRIGEPTAIDAQGQSVPTALSLVDGKARVTVAGGGDYAYPILIDPPLDWYIWTIGPGGYGDWNWVEGVDQNTSPPNPPNTGLLHGTSCIYHCWYPNGLFISSPSSTYNPPHGGYRPAHAYGQWFYQVPGGYSSQAIISSLSVSPFYRDDHSTGSSCKRCRAPRLCWSLDRSILVLYPEFQWPVHCRPVHRRGPLKWVIFGQHLPRLRFFAQLYLAAICGDRHGDWRQRRQLVVLARPLCWLGGYLP